MNQELGKMKYKTQSMAFVETLAYRMCFQDDILFGLILTYLSISTYR